MVTSATSSPRSSASARAVKTSWFTGKLYGYELSLEPIRRSPRNETPTSDGEIPAADGATPAPHAEASATAWPPDAEAPAKAQSRAGPRAVAAGRGDEPGVRSRQRIRAWRAVQPQRTV